jgi:hypothetical protein
MNAENTLTLRRQSIRTLTTDELRKAHGGGNNSGDFTKASKETRRTTR